MSRPHTPSGESAMRASDTDREQVARLLQQQFAAGRLSLAECDDRTRTAYAARTRPQLDTLIEDLPEPAPLPRAKPERAAKARHWCCCW